MSNGWCSFATPKPNTHNFWPGNKGRRAVVLHVTGGRDSRSWLASKASGVSAHFLIRKDGEITQFVSINDSAWANGLSYKGDGLWIDPEGVLVRPSWADIEPPINPNSTTLSLEHEGYPNEPWTQAMDAANTRLLQWIASETGLFYVPRHTLIGHWEISPHNRPNCPGPHVDYQRIANTANIRQPVPVPIPTVAITADTRLISPPRASADLAIAYLNLRGSVYTAEDITKIAGYYWDFGTECGIDPLLAIAQCVHETSAQDPDTKAWKPLSSWWAQRPRRNPCGYGVAGVTQSERPADVLGWTQDTQAGLWRQGLSFGSWEWSVQAHIGRLLLYAIKEGTGTETQRKRMAYAHGLRPLPEHMMGSAPTLAPLGAAHNPTGHGWADPGSEYGAQIAAIANDILQVRP